ncbi:MAG: Slp family lipoprotein [Gammaproteobacteria bacterium]|nr:Slp family lipoprotein [Gammaproteobacteria bacterium]
MQKAWILLCVVLLSACASPPFDLTGIDKELTPDAVLAKGDTTRGQRVTWGGMIINSNNRKDVTEIEVLGYPLDRSARPDTNNAPQHRFIISKEGYLETADFRPGRLISAIGTTAGTHNGKVGEAAYVYPVLQAEQLHLWPISQPRAADPNVHFGIGIIFH